MKLLMKLGCLTHKIIDGARFFWKKSHVRDNALKHPENRVFLDFAKKKKLSPLIWRFFGFKSCTIMTFMILLKLYVWKRYDSQVK